MPDERGGGGAAAHRAAGAPAGGAGTDQHRAWRFRGSVRVRETISPRVLPRRSSRQAITPTRPSSMDVLTKRHREMHSEDAIAKVGRLILGAAVAMLALQIVWGLLRYLW